MCSGCATRFRAESSVRLRSWRTTGGSTCQRLAFSWSQPTLDRPPNQVATPVVTADSSPQVIPCPCRCRCPCPAAAARHGDARPRTSSVRPCLVRSTRSHPRASSCGSCPLREPTRSSRNIDRPEPPEASSRSRRSRRSAIETAAIPDVVERWGPFDSISCELPESKSFGSSRCWSG